MLEGGDTTFYDCPNLPALGVNTSAVLHDKNNSIGYLTTIRNSNGADRSKSDLLVA